KSTKQTPLKKKMTESRKGTAEICLECCSSFVLIGLISKFLFFLSEFQNIANTTVDNLSRTWSWAFPWLPGLTELQSDDDIIRAVQRGDRNAFGLLYQRYFPSVWRFVYARLRGCSCQDVEDVVSETWVAAIRGIGHFDPQRGTVFCSWLVGIAKNKV